MLFEPMSKPAPSDASTFSVPCKHCAALLHPQERICPFCGYDQGVTGAGEGPPPLEFESVDTLPPLQDEQTLVMPRPDRKRVPGRAIVAAQPIAVRPVPYAPPESFWQQEEPARRGPLRWVSGLAISFLAALVLFALTLAVDYFYFDRRSEPGRARAFQADIAEVRGALDRGDLAGAERALEALDAAHAEHPSVQPLREELDSRLQEQEARREQLRDAAKSASRALGLSEPAAAPPAAPRPASPAAVAPVAAPSPATPGTAASPSPAMSQTPADGEHRCTEALAALALCVREGPGAP